MDQIPACLNGLAVVEETLDANVTRSAWARPTDEPEWVCTPAGPYNWVDPRGLCEQGPDFQQCEALRQELCGWGVRVIYSGITNVECLPQEVVKAITNDALAWKLSEMKAIYDAFRIFARAHTQFVVEDRIFNTMTPITRLSANYDYRWPLADDKVIRIEKNTQIPPPGLPSDFGIHFYGERKIILSDSTGVSAALSGPLVM
jgi:hypothetical protein